MISNGNGSQKKILFIDNYDSFTNNLVHLFASLGAELEVKRNDDLSILSALSENQYRAVIIGPGPGSPEDDEYFGVNRQVILEYGTKGVPILGVCLGFQGIWHTFGGALKRATLPQHGKLSKLTMIANRPTIMAGVPTDVEVMRYHSIHCVGNPDCFRLEAMVTEGEGVLEDGNVLMAISHKVYPIYGVQFHPESYTNPQVGRTIAHNFLQLL